MHSLTGDLGFASATTVLAEVRPALAQGDGPFELDLSGVTRVDSAGLALLLELARAARGRNRELRCANAPEQLRNLAGFFGVAGLLALSA